MLKLTRKSICEALLVPEHRMRTWMKLSPFRKRLTSARVAREFDASDLLLLAIAQTLEDKYKLRKESLDHILPPLDEFIRRPLRTTRTGLIFINIKDWQVDYFSVDTCEHPGIVINLAAEQERVARYLGLMPAQDELPFGLQSLIKVNQ